MQGKLAASFAKVFSQQMPERLDKILLLNPPSVFSMLLTAARPFVDKRTLDKVVVIKGANAEVLKTLSNEHNFPQATVTWLEKTLACNVSDKLPELPAISKQLLLPGLVSKFTIQS